MKNKALAIRAIKKDCKIRFKYINRNGDTCAIGMLALKAGVSKSELKEASGSKVWASELKSVVNAICRKFGLQLGHLEHIQNINDQTDMLMDRRAAILNYLDNL